jgi:hypothetical protein
LKYFKVPVILYGEGQYVMSDVKQVDATEAFLGLAENSRGCQNEITLEDCWMKKYLKDGIDKCKCFPLSFKNYSTHEVICKIFCKQ